MNRRPDPAERPADALLYRLEWLDEAARIVAAMLAIVARFEHYKSCPEKKIKRALYDELPGVRTYFAIDKDFSTIGVVYRLEADNQPTDRPIPYEDRLHVTSYPSREHAGETWAAQIRRSLAALDLDGQRARMENEQAKLGALADVAAKLARQIAAAQEEARAILGLADGAGPSREISKAFPSLF